MGANGGANGAIGAANGHLEKPATAKAAAKVADVAAAEAGKANDPPEMPSNKDWRYPVPTGFWGGVKRVIFMDTDPLIYTVSRAFGWALSRSLGGPRCVTLRGAARVTCALWRIRSVSA
jgi:hypothetical protein